MNPAAASDRSKATRVRIQAMGGYRIVVDGRDLRLRTRKEAMLLLRLALAGAAGVTRDDCVGMLWPESSEARARHSLSEALRGIELATGLVVERSPERLAMAPEFVSLDVRELEEAIARGDVVESARLHSGGFLAGWYPPTAEASHWVDGVGASVATRLEKMLRRELASRRQSTDSRGVTAAVALLEQLGVATDADREIGAEAEQITAWESVRAGDSIQANIPVDREGPFVGRVEEMKLLTRELERAMNGELRVVLVSGEAGIGKTRTCQRLARLAALRGARLFLSNCYELEQSVAYGAIGEALAGSVTASDVAGLKPAWQRAVVSLLPDLEITAHDATTSPAAPYVIMRSVVELLRVACQERPGMILVDDLQWCDASSTQVLNLIIRTEAPAAGVLLLLSYRDDEIEGNSSARTLERAAELVAGSHVRLGPVSPTDLSLQVQSLLGDMEAETDVTSIVALADGNPFFAHELALTQVQHRRTNAIEEVIMSRVRRLNPDDREVLEIVAVAGAPIEFVDLARSSARTLSDVARSVHLLARLRFIRDDASRVVVSHEIARATVVGSLDPAARRSIHARVASAMEGKWPPALLATHYALAGVSGKAAAYAKAAANISGSKRAFEEEAGWLALALEHSDDKTAELSLVTDRLFALGRYVDAEAAIDKYRGFASERTRFKKELAALKRSHPLGTPDVLQACDHLFETAVQRGYDFEAAEVLREHIRLAQEMEDVRLAMRTVDRLLEYGLTSKDRIVSANAIAIALLKLVTYEPPRVGPLLDWLKSAVADVELPDDVLVNIGMVEAIHEYNCGNITRAGVTLLRQIKRAREQGDFATELRMVTVLIPLSSDAMRVGRAARRAQFILDYAKHTNMVWERQLSLLNMAVAWWDGGRLEKVEATVLEMQNELAHMPKACEVFVHALLGHCAIAMSRWEDATHHAARVRDLVGPVSGWLSDMSLIATMLFRESVSRGDDDRALHFLEEATQRATGRHQVPCWTLQLERERYQLLRALPIDEVAVSTIHAAAKASGCRLVVWKAESLLGGRLYN